MTHEILNTQQMAKADELTIKGGIPGYTLMQNAGKAIFDVILSHYPDHKILVLAGPGNNGGDGFVAAQLLNDKGFDVCVAGLVPVDKLKGDAQKAGFDYKGKLYELGDKFMDNLPFSPDLVVDALFGTGLSRALTSPVTDTLKWVREMSIPVLAVDVPSGVFGQTGKSDPYTVSADHTVTFFRKKLGHVLHPGRSLCGQIHLRDIGISENILKKTGISGHENHPDLWLEKYPHPVDNTHKYKKGLSVIYGGPKMCGAVHMASLACMRIGSGLCRVVTKPEASDLYRTILPPHIIVTEDPDWNDQRVTARLIGPGAGEDVDKFVDEFLRYDVPIVLDADALSQLKPFTPHVVLTPHEGEFEKLCPEATGSKLEKVLYASQKTAAVIVLKGSDTVVAQQGRTCVINTHTSPALATAGTGDVLAGMITGLLAQGMTAFDAACAAVWMHGEAGIRLGTGCVAPDIPDAIPAILQELLP
mgnify:CR=1 FL=1